MEIIVIGLNHRTAPIEIRERLSFQAETIENALREASSLPSVRENMILSTCNRVEIYAAVRNTEKATFELKNFLSQHHHVPLKEFEKCLYAHVGEDAVRHIFRVASSLDSMVVGEPQVSGQIKSAYEVATQASTSGFILHRLLHRAFHVAKRVRTETQISNSAVSVSSVAVDLAKTIFETLQGRTVLLIGAGEMCELAAQHLISGGVEKVLVTNRTYERAVTFAQSFKGEPVPFDEMDRGLKRADIVISATDSREYLLRHDPVARVMKERKQKPIFFIDIADPRDIDPAVGDIENVYLYNIDDLQKVATDNIRDREKEAQRAEGMVQDEVVKFVRWYRSLDRTPTIIALRKKFEEIRKKELDKTLALNPDLSEKEKKSLEALTSSIINKILHDPLTLLKKGQEETLTDLYLDALQTLFQLEAAESTQAQEKSEDTAGEVDERVESNELSRT